MWRLATARGIVVILLTSSSISSTFTGAQSVSTSTPTRWIVVKDKTKTCQMSVPGDWKPRADLPGHVVSPEHTESMLISGFQRSHQPMSETTQKAVQADNVFENSADRWFYVSRPILGTNGKPTLVVYHVDVARDDGTCIAQILVNQNHQKEEVQKIAASVSAVKPQEKQNRSQR